MSEVTLIQTKTTSTGPLRQTIASSVPVVITGLSIDFTPLSDNSIIVVEAQIVSTATYVCNWSVYKDGSPTVSTSGYTNNVSANGNYTTYVGGNNAGWLWCMPLQWSEENSSTTQRTYDIRTHSRWSGSNKTTYINNRSSNDMASFSSMVITEYLKK